MNELNIDGQVITFDSTTPAGVVLYAEASGFPGAIHFRELITNNAHSLKCIERSEDSVLWRMKLVGCSPVYIEYFNGRLWGIFR